MLYTITTGLVIMMQGERSCISIMKLTAFCFCVEQVQLVLSVLRVISVQRF